jgi:hypothetical protein
LIWNLLKSSPHFLNFKFGFISLFTHSSPYIFFALHLDVGVPQGSQIDPMLHLLTLTVASVNMLSFIRTCHLSAGFHSWDPLLALVSLFNLAIEHSCRISTF